MYLSRVANVSSEISLGADAKVRNAFVTSGKMSHTAHAVILPRPAKLETVSHPVIAWKTGSALDLSGPSEAASLCAAM